MTIRKIHLLSLLFAAFFVLSPSAAFAKDEWVQVRSKNFFLVGNASEKDIRKVATKLEQFRETFRQVFRTVNLNASVPTNVVVFKSHSSYKDFKPRRDDGKVSEVSGYFQPGEDVNYITLTTEGTDERMYETIFHEYVHFIIDTNYGRAQVPQWFNEGLAEYYSTFSIEEDQKVKLGRPDNNHLALLQQSKLIPLGTFFNVSNHALHQQGGHSKVIFYAQAWAIVHYLVQNGKSEGLNKFLAESMANKPAEQAFQEAFGFGYDQMEKELRKYVGQSSYLVNVLTFKNKLTFDTDMRSSPLTEGDSNAYLGDLLYHTHRWDEAEPYLRTALSMNPDSSMANTTLGMVKIRQRKFDDAKAFLEKAIAQDPRNHLAFYRYAYLLTREGRDEFGFVSSFDTATAAKIRQMLKKAIAINPAYTESYELLAFVNLINNEELDDAVAQLQMALKYQPGNMRYAMRIAEIYLRQNKYKEAGVIAEKIAKRADDDELRYRAETLAARIKQQEEMFASLPKTPTGQSPPASGTGVGEPRLLKRRTGEIKPTDEEIARASEDFQIRGLNQSLRRVGAGEVRLLGKVVKIDCKNTVTYSITTDTDAFQLASKDFQTLSVMTFITDAGDAEVGCRTDISKNTAVITYKPDATAKAPIRGELVALEFVPANFRFVDLKTEAVPPTYVVEETGPPPTAGAIAEERRSGMMQAIRDRIRKPADGEKRDIGFIEKSECSSKGMFFHIKVGAQLLKLAAPQGMFLGGYTPDIEQLQIGCSMKSVDVPIVFVYRPTSPLSLKATGAGELVSVEFVPKTFTLD